MSKKPEIQFFYDSSCYAKRFLRIFLHTPSALLKIET